MQYGNSTQEIAIKKIEGGLRGLKFGTKTLHTAEIDKWLDKLRPLNQGMYEELQAKYTEIIKKLQK